MREYAMHGDFRWMTRLEALYDSKGIRRNAQCLKLHEVYPYAEECWRTKDVSNRRNKSSMTARPWIGGNYEYAKVI